MFVCQKKWHALPKGRSFCKGNYTKRTFANSKSAKSSFAKSSAAKGRSTSVDQFITLYQFLPVDLEHAY